jgi:hypothetical protein
MVLVVAQPFDPDDDEAVLAALWAGSQRLRLRDWPLGLPAFLYLGCAMEAKFSNDG